MHTHSKSCSNCCLSETPTPISENLNHQLKNLAQPSKITPNSPNFTITPNMFISDLYRNFPKLQQIFHDLSPLEQDFTKQNLPISLYFYGTGLNLNQICASLNQALQQNTNV